MLAIPRVYKGNVNTSLIKAGELFKQAVRENCPALVVVHNHPSGDLTFSPKALIRGRPMCLPLHKLIVGQQCYISIRERGRVLIKCRSW